MKRYIRWTRTAVLVAICATAFSGCKKDKGEGTTASQKSSRASGEQPDYQKYAPLPKIVTDPTVPFLVDQTGVVDISCFKKKSDINTQTASMEIKAAIEKKSSYLKEVIGKWVLDDLSPSGITEDDVTKWEISVEYPVMLEFDPMNLRFEDSQECIQESTGWLDQNVRAVTTLIGARNFTITSSSRLTIDQQDNLMEALKSKGMTMSGQGLDFYKPVLDSEGNPKYNSENEALYTGPGGISITEKDMPPESERGVKEFTIKAENPLFFAFREIPNSAWQKIQKKKECYVFVVWGDVKPRAPDCAEFTSALFAAEKIDDQTIKVEVTVDSKSQKMEIPFETTQKIMMGNRVLLWINVKKEEEGATIRFNSLVIGELFKQ